MVNLQCMVSSASTSPVNRRLPVSPQHKIYMYGGKIDSTGNITNQLWVFHIHNQSWVLASPRAKEQYAVVGQSAHVVQLAQDSSVMLVIFGHCPLYGYISKVQEYNIGEWHSGDSRGNRSVFNLVRPCCEISRQPVCWTAVR